MRTLLLTLALILAAPATALAEHHHHRHAHHARHHHRHRHAISAAVEVEPAGSCIRLEEDGTCIESEVPLTAAEEAELAAEAAAGKTVCVREAGGVCVEDEWFSREWLEAEAEGADTPVCTPQLEAAGTPCGELEP